MAEPIRARSGWTRGNLLVRLLMLLSLSFAALAQPAAAQSILRDAETEALFRDMSRPIVEAAGLRPENVQFVLIHDRSINAFVVGGQAVYLHSGLITAADNANEVQGVIAHEIGHITGGHVLRFHEGVKVATGIMLLSLVLGAAAMAAGAGEAALASWPRAAGGDGQVPRLHPHPGSSADAAGPAFSTRPASAARAALPSSRSSRTRVSLRYSPGRQLCAHPPADRRADGGAGAGLQDRAVRGTRTDPRSRRVSSG
jgi:hypothetical protein